MSATTQRKEVPTQYPDIFKIVVLNPETGKWVEPERGKKFKARRYDKRPDGSIERIKRSFESLAEAKAFRAGAPVEEKNTSMQAKHVPQDQIDPNLMTFGQLVDKWSKSWLPTKNLSTQLKYQSYLKHFQFFWDFPVEKIDPDRIDQWITHITRPEYLEGCHSTRCSYIHEIGCLKTILNYYSTRVNRSYRLPFLRDHRGMTKVREKPTIKKDLTVEQFQAFIQKLKDSCIGTKWEPIYFLALMQYALYARIQSAAALHVEDFDLMNNRLEMTRKVQWLRKKDVKDRVVPGSKTDGGKVFSPIPQLAVQVFNEWRARSGVSSGLLFQIEGKLIAYRTIQNKYDRALKAAGLPFTATHLLRHAALVEAYNICRDMLAIQKLANHRDLRATEKYAKVRDKQVEATQRQMDERVAVVWQK
jgi:integrase